MKRQSPHHEKGDTVTKSNHQFIIVEPRKIIALSIRNILAERYSDCRIHPVGSLESAVKSVFAVPANAPEDTSDLPSQTVFLIGGTSYWDMLDFGTRIRAVLPESRFVLIDDCAKPGCGVVADRLPVQGYTTLHDTTRTCYEAVDTVLRGELHLSSCGEKYLEADLKSRALRSRQALRKELPYAFNRREWHCFRMLLAGKECEEIAPELSMTDRSTLNLKYRIMKKMGVRHFVDVLRIAHRWGLFDP